MKQKNSFIYFGFAFLLGAGLMLLLSTRANVAAEANSKPAAAVASDISSAFTYQGTLDDGGSPANGQYDFLFNLWDAVSGGSVSAVPVTVSNVTVTNGRFTVEIDFASNVYAFEAVWIEIEVREVGKTEYETLTPRQPITVAPLALSLPNVYSNPTTNTVVIDAETEIYNGDLALFGGDVTQDLNNNGLVKAAVYVGCSDSASSVSRSFNNVNSSSITISNGASVGRCTIDFGFDLNQRYWSINPTDTLFGGPTLNQASCGINLLDTSQLDCLVHLSGTGTNGKIFVTIH